METAVNYYRVYNTKRRSMDIIALDEAEASDYAYRYGLVRAKANARVFQLDPKVIPMEEERRRLTLHAMALRLSGRCSYNAYSRYLHVGYRAVRMSDLPQPITIET